MPPKAAATQSSTAAAARKGRLAGRSSDCKWIWAHTPPGSKRQDLLLQLVDLKLRTQNLGFKGEEAWEPRLKKGAP